jgi:hypothetical protein
MITVINKEILHVHRKLGQIKNSPVSSFPTVPKFYPPTLNFLWPQITLHTKISFQTFKQEEM